jgi:hypothetical protein
VADGEQGDIQGNIAQPVKEKYDAEKKQQMVIAGEHVLGAQVHEWNEMDAADFLDVAFVAFGDAMRQGASSTKQQERCTQEP